MYKTLFWASTWACRPFVNVSRTRRVIRWLAQRAYGNCRPAREDFRWHRDRYGLEYLLHPHFHVDYQIIAFGTYDRAVNNYIDRHVHPGMVCIDAGANIGVMSLHLAQRVGGAGKVYSFEPDPHIFDRLQGHVKRNGFERIISPHPVALSNESGRAAMALCDRHYPIQGLGSLVNRELPEPAGETFVETLALDEFEEPLSRLDLIKIDVQGAEPLLLAGGRQTLEEFGPDLLMEISPGDLKGCGMNSIDLLAQVEEMGYECFELQRSGQVGARINSQKIAPDYYKNAVLCRKQRKVRYAALSFSQERQPATANAVSGPHVQIRHTPARPSVPTRGVPAARHSRAGRGQGEHAPVL